MHNETTLSNIWQTQGTRYTKNLYKTSSLLTFYITIIAENINANKI